MVRPEDEADVGIHLRAFNWHLVEARGRLGWTQERLADLAGVKLHRLSMFECLRRWPEPNEATNLAAILGEDKDVLFPPGLRARVANVPSSVRFKVPLTALPAPQEPDLIEAPFNAELRARLIEQIETLTAREQVVVRRRFGFDDGISRTREEVAREQGVTYTRIAQIEQKALRRLRIPKRSKKLRGFVEES